MAKLPTLDELISLEHRRAMITGAGTGIGQAIALRFAQAGADLDLVDIDEELLALAKPKLARFNRRITTHVVDLADKSAIDQLWENLEHAAPSILVNNAGIYPIKRFVDVKEKFLQRVMETNLHSAFWMCQHMIRRRLKTGGVIINLGSIEALVPFKDDMAHYSMSKAGVIALTRSLAKEYGKHGFRVNALVPGGIITRGTKTVAKRIFRMQLGLLKTGIEFRQRLPLGRAGQPDEIARMALVLASDLSSYVHGAAIPVDGGFLSA